MVEPKKTRTSRAKAPGAEGQREPVEGRVPDELTAFEFEQDKGQPKSEKELDDQLDTDVKTVSADETLLNLNDEIASTIEAYFKGTGIQIRFDIPEKEDPPNDPTLCVFLYDIQEDLELRHGQPRVYDMVTQTFAPGQVHVRCCYLITYWESKNVPETSLGPRSQSMRVMNLVLNALLNLQLATIVPTFKRVIAPSEHLSSLGNFWQALGNKPRLCLNFAVTVPISLRADKKNDAVKRVLQLHGEVAPSVSPKAPELDVAGQLRNVLVDALKSHASPKSAFDHAKLTAQLDSLTIQCKGDSNVKDPRWDVTVSGVLEETLHTQAKSLMETWTKTWPLSDQPGQLAKNVDDQKLVSVGSIQAPAITEAK
ncbi:DUF4255 domain-containing protein [Burkholderia stagnalis]|uniref:DUF4255 domain-containing protein n=1 Tax=Burkholderia stagnalis TaxID=1503054 RepID=UPI002AB517B2|nr:DUF4255 domain-containing protein [Burkholderia stagnalis]MDY7806697.1 DUF4255 domain-containing protein [Burkholderia stagnalis]